MRKRPEPRREASKSSPINATWLRRHATLATIALLKRFRKQLSGVLFLTSAICVKYGERIDLAEAATLQYVRTHTSIPVPRVHCAFEHSGKTYIVMQRLPGTKLAFGWQKRSKETQHRILAQLKAMVDELRALPSPHGPAVASVDGGSLTDPRLPGLGLTYPIRTSDRFGPFEDIKSFHRWLRRPATEIQDDTLPDVKQLISLHETREWEPPVLTHGDLSSLNTLVDGEDVTGIVDWETSGWYPAYWEYTTAMQAPFRTEFWKDYVEDFLEPRPQDLDMERFRQEYFGGP